MKAILIQFCVILLCLLFAYTSASKFLDYDKFVFQMRLAPVPFVKTVASVLGWLIPSIEMVIAVALATGMFIPSVKIKAFYASVILLFVFEIYITVILLSGSHLPCTCGGIISTMGWKQHLFFNAFFIVTGFLSIRYLQQHKAYQSSKHKKDDFKILSRA